MMDSRHLDPSRDWLVVGWFTPDYRPLAESLAIGLDCVSAPHHLFAKPKRPGGWDTRRKPEVVLEAMDLYPDKTIVLMDVDCIVAGDIEPVTRFDGDVAINVKAQHTRRLWRPRKPIAVSLSSRVVVFRPTAKARAFAQEWHRLCQQAKTGGDEISMAWAYLNRPDIAYAAIDQRYAGRGIAGAERPDTVIAHDSVHERAIRFSPKMLAKALERKFFRRGWTKRVANETMPVP